MRIRFTRDFRSARTGERFYVAYTQAEIDDAAARALIAEGVAEPVPIAAREKQAAPAPPRNAPARKP